jgi:ribosomal-protein-alanine N-acetyltransferase
MELLPATFETERLTFERLCRENVDVLELYRICSGEEIDDVSRYMPWSPHQSPKETLEYVKEVEARWEEGTGGEWVIRPKASEDGAGDIAGMTDFVVDWERRTAALGIWLRKRYWGRGYSGERAAKLFEFAFELLDLELVSIEVDDRNEPSIQAVETYVDRYNGSCDGLLRNWGVNGGTPVDKRRYTVSHEEYRQSTS